MDRLNFDVQIKDVEQISPLLSKCKVYICYSDLNRNNSIISRDLIDRKLYTLKNCPIVGQYSKDKGDFTDHGGKLEEDDDGNLQYIVTTIPYGLIPESSDIKWEFVDGADYLSCTGFLWTARYPEGLKAIEEGRPQSMEIQEVQGEFNNKKQFIVSDFVFSALTILGQDVEPCFEGAKIEGYSLDKSSIETEINKMAEELKQIDSNLHAFNKNSKEGEMVKTKQEIATQFNLTVNQLSEEMERTLCSIKYKTTNWYDEEVEYNRFYLRDFDDQFAYACDRQNNYIDVKIPYSMSGDNVVFDVEGIKRIKYVPTDWEEGEMQEEVEGNFALRIVEEAKAEFDKLKSDRDSISAKLAENDEAVLAMNEKFTVIQSELDAKKQEIETLKSFKKEIQDKERKEQVDGLFTRYSKHLTKEEIEDLRNKEPQFESIDEFAKEFKSFVCDKITLEIKPNQTYSRMGILPEEKSNTESSNVWDRLSNNK